MAKILVIDDNQDVLNVIISALNANNHETVAASSGESGIRELEQNEFDIVLTDLKMPGIGGIEVLDHVMDKVPETLCIILTGHGTIPSSVEAIKKGAFDYITKPFAVGDLLFVVEKALQFKQLKEENVRLKKELREKYGLKKIIGTSKAITDIYDIIKKVADTDGTILITGPSGTGKELIARAIHYHSSRSDKPLVVINCGAIPEELLESELFGHERGAFTGAHKNRIGRFEMANGGTVFLDEIGEMSPSLQVKLLRVLQDQMFERVGGTKTLHVDLRFIAATNKNLTTAINKGTFREDLFYRLNVIPIKLPLLKQRKLDIPLLVDHFLKRMQLGKEKRIKEFSSAAMEALMAYDWPGNVRELENVVKRLSILCENPIVTFHDLPENIREMSESMEPAEEDAPDETVNLNDAVRDYEKRLILEALEKSRWVKSKAAKLLNINRTTLVEKIKKQKLEDANIMQLSEFS